jgi:hypothetical protein
MNELAHPNIRPASSKQRLDLDLQKALHILNISYQLARTADASLGLCKVHTPQSRAFSGDESCDLFSNAPEPMQVIQQ